MKISTIILAIASILVISCKTDKEETFEKFQFANPEQVGMNSDSLANIDSLVKEYIEAKKFLELSP